MIGPAPTLRAALALAHEENLSGAILDIHIAGEQVFPAAAALSRRGVPILFHTGHGDSAALDRDWPGSRTLLKPASHEALLAAMLALLGGGTAMGGGRMS